MSLQFPVWVTKPSLPDLTLTSSRTQAIFHALLFSSALHPPCFLSPSPEGKSWALAIAQHSLSRDLWYSPPDGWVDNNLLSTSSILSDSDWPIWPNRKLNTYIITWSSLFLFSFWKRLKNSWEQACIDYTVCHWICLAVLLWWHLLRQLHLCVNNEWQEHIRESEKSRAGRAPKSSSNRPLLPQGRINSIFNRDLLKSDV